MLTIAKDKTKLEVFYEMGSNNWIVANAINRALAQLIKDGAPQSVQLYLARLRDEYWENSRRDAMAILMEYMGNPQDDTPWPKVDDLKY